MIKVGFFVPEQTTELREMAGVPRAGEIVRLRQGSFVVKEVHWTAAAEDSQGDFARGVPAMVFGQGSKLRSDGPFLAVLVEFDRLLSQTGWMTVVGYSFRDDHINAAHTCWLNGDRSKRISIIDPSLESWGELRSVRHSPE